VGKAEEDLERLVKWLQAGYVLVDGSNIGAALLQSLEDDGYPTVAVYPRLLPSRLDASKAKTDRKPKREPRSTIGF
jgi:hypothetical protein